MAELLAAGKWGVPSSLGAYLRDALPDGYYVVLDVVVRGCPLDGVVVGPNGLTAVKVNGADGAGGPASATRVSPAWGQNVLQLFLRDEFPSLRPSLRFVRAEFRPGETDWTVVEPLDMGDTDLARAIARQPADPDSLLASDVELREAVALALRDRQLTATQRASHPFVFRSGGLLGNAVRAWTVRDVARHMDAHPEDGIYHLRNGTLESWLEAEGAAHLARLARAAVNQVRNDPRASLEIFLLGTGLVAPPRLAARPPVVDLGYAVAGESAARSLRLGRGRGRGYLFGNVAPVEPWLDVEPRSFAGGPAEFVVRADTAALQVGGLPHVGSLEVDCSASPEPLAIPVRLRVVAMPAPAARLVLRPLVAAALAGLLGAAAGAALDLWAEAAPHPFGPGLSWSLVVGLVWAAFGALRGFRQPPAWPIVYAAARWLLRLAASAVVLPLCVVVLVWLAAGADPAAGLGPASVTSAALFALACAAVPATVSELDSVRARQTKAEGPGTRPIWRRVAVPAVGILLIAALLAGVPLLRPAWQRPDVQAGVSGVQSGFQDVWTRLDGFVKSLLDRLYLGYYGR